MSLLTRIRSLPTLRGRRLAAICLSAVLAGCATACSATGPTATGPAKGSTMKLGLSMPTLNTPFFTVLVNEATAQAKARGGKVVQTTNANRDASQQVNDFRNLIAAGANVILAGVVDRAAIQPALDYAKTQHVPVVIVDDAPAAGAVYAVVKADNEAMAAKAAEVLAAQLPKTGTILEIMGGLTTTNGQDRKNGFDKEFKKEAPGVKVIQQSAEWDGPKSANVMSTVLSSTPELNGVFLATDTLYYDPVAATLKARGRLASVGQPGHIPMVAIDGGVESLDAIRKGYLDATVSQPVIDYAKYGVDYLQDALDGKETKAGATDHDSTVVKNGSYFIDELPAPVVTKKNVDDSTLWGNKS